jgi:hypothetical protein
VKLLEKMMQLSLVRNNSKLIECHCGEYMEIMEGKVDYNYKDDNGK